MTTECSITLYVVPVQNFRGALSSPHAVVDNPQLSKQWTPDKHSVLSPPSALQKPAKPKSGSLGNFALGFRIDQSLITPRVAMSACAHSYSGLLLRYETLKNDAENLIPDKATFAFRPNFDEFWCHAWSIESIKVSLKLI